MKVENVKVEKLDNLGRGIARIDNKIVFIENALPEEVVDIEIIKDKKNYSLARRINLDKSLNIEEKFALIVIFVVDVI